MEEDEYQDVDEYQEEEKESYWLIKTVGRDITELVIYIIITALLFAAYFALGLVLPTERSGWVVPNLTGRNQMIFVAVAVCIFLLISFLYGNRQKGMKGLFKFIDIIIMMLILWVIYIICLIPITMDINQVVIYAVEIARNPVVWGCAVVFILPGRILAYMKYLFSSIRGEI
ncbi:MAG: hypothetical protein FWC53_02280 [Firmicutes bacterium]|nr:hypothetical protein [Bacillota bacterium]